MMQNTMQNWLRPAKKRKLSQEEDASKGFSDGKQTTTAPMDRDVLKLRRPLGDSADPPADHQHVPSLAPSPAPSLAPSPAPSSTIQILNSLNQSERAALHKISQEHYKFNSATPKLDEETAQALEGLDFRGITKIRSGSWYLAWATYQVSRASSNGRHSQLQLRLNVSDPTKSSGKIKRLFGQTKFANLQQSVWGAPRDPTRQWKPHQHHIAFLARPDVPYLPEDLGKGSSVSHQCDTTNCIRTAHLSLATRHKDNMDKQRCEGVVLIVYRGQVLMECGCRHGSSDDSVNWDLDPEEKRGLDMLAPGERAKVVAEHNKIASSCIGVRIINLSETSIVAANLVDEKGVASQV